MFVPQSPVEEDILFASVPGFLANLEAIASHIAAPALKGETSRPMTFGIYGRWGAGKSTALRQLRALVESQVAGAVEVTTSHYSAPQWQSSEHPQASLTYSILSALDADAVFRAVRRDTSDPIGLGDRVNREAEFLTLARSFESSPALLQQWSVEISKALAATGDDGARPRVHIAFVDDVDRCSRRFTADLLAATTFWDNPGQANIFFVIAASERHLLDALKAHLPLGSHSAQQALEKYVHLSVSVPAMLTDVQQIGDFVQRLAGLARVDGDDQSLTELRELLADSMSSHPDCVMAPLLDPGVDLTPRAVKHRLNTFLAEFRPHGAVEIQDVKQWVLKAFWPDFWWSYLWPLRQTTRDPEKARQVSEYLQRLTGYGKTLLPLWGLGDERLTPALRYLAERDGVDLREATPHLAMYLAAEPSWKPPADLWADSLVTPQEPAPHEKTSTTETDFEILRLYLEADQARERGDDAEAGRALAELIALITSDAAIPAASAPTIGNAALLAENLQDMPSARLLHLKAHDLEPRHWNIAQNLLDYIIDARDETLFDLAEELQRKLKADGSEHRPDRTRGLIGRFAAMRGDEDGLLLAIEEALQTVDAEPTVQALRQLLRLAGDRIPLAERNRVCRKVAERAELDVDRYNALRMYADDLTTASSMAVKREAAAIFRYLLESGLARLEQDEVVEVMHNLAILYDELGHTGSSLEIFTRIYETRPGKQSSRRALAVTLDHMGHGQAAAAVLLGQALPEMDVPPADAPAVIETDGERWWEQLPVDRYEPIAIPDGLDAP